MNFYSINKKRPLACWIPSHEETAEDLTGTQNGVLTNGATIVADTGAGGKFAFDLDGIDQFVDTPFNPLTRIGSASSWAVSLWMKQTESKNNARIFGNSAGTRWYLATTPTGVFWGFGNTVNSATGITVSFGEWMHIIWQRNAVNNTIQCYCNGVKTQDIAYAGVAGFHNFTTQIGDVAVSPTSFNGRIDDVRVWGAVLTDAEAVTLSGKRAVITNPAVVTGQTGVY